MRKVTFAVIHPEAPMALSRGAIRAQEVGARVFELPLFHVQEFVVVRRGLAHVRARGILTEASTEMYDRTRALSVWTESLDDKTPGKRAYHHIYAEHNEDTEAIKIRTMDVTNKDTWPDPDTHYFEQPLARDTLGWLEEYELGRVLRVAKALGDLHGSTRAGA